MSAAARGRDGDRWEGEWFGLGLRGKVGAAGCAAGRAGSDIGIPVGVRVVPTQQGVLWACWPGCFLPGPGGEGKAAIAEGFPEAFSLGHVLL